MQTQHKNSFLIVKIKNNMDFKQADWVLSLQQEKPIV